MTKPRQWLLGTIATAALAGVFMLYAQPDFMVQMVNQVWGCF